MKKSLLMTLFYALATTMLWAQSEVVDFTTMNLSDAASVTSIDGTGCTVSFTNAKWYNNGNAIRVYNGGSMTVASKNNTAIESIELTLASGGGSNAITPDVGTLSGTTWTGNNETVTFTIGGTSGNRRLQAITVNYSTGVAMPVISGTTPFTGSTTVTITAEGADHIYYTIDGTEPTMASTLYTSSFTLNQTTTVKAIAKKDETVSHTAAMLFSAYKPYTLVTSLDDLTDGCQVLIVGANNNTVYGMGAQSGNHNRTATPADTDGSGTMPPTSISVGNDHCVMLLGKSGNTYTFYDMEAGGYLQAISSTANQMITDELNENAQATISLESNNMVSITFGSTFTRNCLRFNYNNDSPLFSCYSSGSGGVKKVYLYVLNNASNDWAGDGSEVNPYLIATSEQLSLLSDRVNEGNSYTGVYFQLAKDLTFSGSDNFTAIGTTEHPFYGLFNGGGYTISGISNSGNRLFETVAGGATIDDCLWLGDSYAKAYFNNVATDVYTVTSGTEGLNVSLVSGSAIVRGSTIYAASGAELHLLLSVDGGKGLETVSATAGTLIGEGAERTLTMAAANTSITATLINGWGGSGTSSDPYTISDAAGWNLLADKVNNGETFSGKFFALTGNISVTTMVGLSEAKSFQGTFDGQGHTLTFNYGSSDSPSGDSPCAPFRWIKNAAIMRLHTTGAIYTNWQFAAGIVGRTFGTSSLTSCRSSVEIHASRSGDGSHGGLVAIINHYDGNNRNISRLTYTNCLFDGKLVTTNGTTSCGGFMAYTHGNTVVMNNCLFNPSEVTSSMGESTLLRKGTGTITINNCYYKTAFGATSGQGLSTDKTGADLQALLGAGWQVDGYGNVVPIMQSRALTGNGTEASPYQIASANDWNDLVYNVNNLGESYAGRFFQLTADISITTTLGTEATPFGGTFDGLSANVLHTLTLDITDNSGAPGTAPFRYIAGATIKNITVNGTVSGGRHTAGLVGYAWVDTNTISGCTVAATVTGSDYMGGIVGHGKGGNNGTETLIIQNSAFTGTMNGGTNYAGGLLGWSDGSTLHVINGIFDGTYSGAGQFHPIAVRNRNEKMTTYTTYCVYTVAPTLTDESYIAATGYRVYKNESDVSGDGIYVVLRNAETSYYARLTVTMKGSVDYTGQTIHPQPTVSTDDGTIIPPTANSEDYYTLTYSSANDAAAGFYTVTINAVENAQAAVTLKGAKTLNYSVVDPTAIATDGEEKYVQMPDKGQNTKTVVIPNDIITLKVYDDGGKNGNYSNEYSGTLTLTVAEGCRLRITGSFELEEGYDMLTIYDGTDNTANALRQLPTGYETWVDEDDNNNNWAICPTIESTGRSLTLFMESDDNDNYGGLNLTVTVLRPHAPTHLTVTTDATKANVSWQANGGTYTVKYRTDAISPVVYYTSFENPLSNEGWSVIDANGDGENWYDDDSDEDAHSGSGFVVSDSYSWDDEENMTPDNWLVSPLLPLKGTMKVWLRALDADSHNEHFAIYASTTGKAVADFTTTLVAETTTPDNTWREYTADLSSFDQNATGYIAIRHFNCTNQEGLLVDDFSINDVGTVAGEWVTLPTTTETQAIIEELTAGINYEVMVTGTMAGYSDASSDIVSFRLATSPRNIELSNSGDNTTLIKNNNGLTANVTLTDRTLTKGGDWNTLCLPFSLSAEQIAASSLADATIKELDNSADGTNLAANGTLTLKFTTVSSIEAGKPYIVKWENASGTVSPVTFSGVTITSTSPTEVTSNDGKVKFVGQYSPYSITEDNKDEILFVGSGNKIGYVSATATLPRLLKNFRAHFWVQPNEGGTGARAINIDWGDGETSSISEELRVKSEKFATTQWYSLDGRKLESNPKQKGIYIVNGKKVVIK